MPLDTLAVRIHELYADPDVASRRAEALAAFAELKVALNRGQARAARPEGGGWRTEAWVKEGILLGFRLGELAAMGEAAGLLFFDKATLPPRAWRLADGVRVVPGGSSIRDGAYVAAGVICMPPMFINIGAYVDEGTMIDSHALVGSCAQIGKRVHLSAGAQVGGVLEPINASPVVIEDDALIGGNTGVYEGTQVGAGAVLGAGVILTRSTPLYDLVRDTIHHAKPGEPLRVPEGAVVVPGARAVTRGQGPRWGLSLYAPVIVKYRDDRTDRAVELEDWLR